MTENIDWTEFDDGDTTPDPDARPSGKGLRAQVEKMAAKLKAVEAENATLKTERSRGQVATAVKDLGYPESVATYYPADASTTPDAVKAWLDQNQAVFRKVEAEPTATAETTDTGTEGTPEIEGDTDVPKDLAELYERLRDLEIVPPKGASSIMARLQAAETEEDVMKIIDGGVA